MSRSGLGEKERTATWKAGGLPMKIWNRGTSLMTMLTLTLSLSSCPELSTVKETDPDVFKQREAVKQNPNDPQERLNPTRNRTRNALLEARCDHPFHHRGSGRRGSRTLKAIRSTG